MKGQEEAGACSRREKGTATWDFTFLSFAFRICTRFICKQDIAGKTTICSFIVLIPFD